MAKRRIGILTGGGDVPGLNSVIKSVTWRGIENGLEVLGIRRGWEGLTHVNLDDPQSRARYLLPLTRDNTRTIDRSGGTVLHTSRVSPSRMRDLPPHLAGREFPVVQVEKNGVAVEYRDLGGQVRRNLETLGVEQLVVIGGDGTLAFAAELSATGFGVVAIPKTMDNDVRGTEYCVGFSTAITRAMAAIERQRTTVGSHERVGVFRVFGRDSGFTALYTGLVTSNRCVIPEYPVDLDRLIALLMEEKRQNPSNYVLVVLSEGARWHGYAPAEYGLPDEHGRRKKVNVGEALSDEIKRRTGEETIVSDLTYDLRSGEPDFIDKLVAQTYGTMALDALLEGRSGLMSALVNGCYQLVPIPDPALGPRTVDVERMYNTERYRPLYGDKRGLPVFLTRW
ncbi:MAG TPA: 6-phosphofructokinase [Anaeromyxobacteraceae bacterium]|nr:6-phosphofructokinase [Anaeromyxobacteraceae bacterium]